MTRRLLNRRAVEYNLKRLRRFAVSLNGDQKSADAMILDILKSNKQIFVPDNNIEDALIFLMKAVYQAMKHSHIEFQNVSLLNPIKSANFDIYLKFHSLKFTERAILSLLLIEDLPRDKIQHITEIQSGEVEQIISRCLVFLDTTQNVTRVAS